jgi:hypothetical protein
VAVRYRGGPSGSWGFETLELRVSRNAIPSNDAERRQQVDGCFEALESSLIAQGITRDWQLAIPDAEPRVQEAPHRARGAAPIDAGSDGRHPRATAHRSAP